MVLTSGLPSGARHECTTHSLPILTAEMEFRMSLRFYRNLLATAKGNTYILDK